MTDLKPFGGADALATHESPHDTFVASKHRNWLAHSAGLTLYAHGRVHQLVGNTIYVGDLVHKRGHQMTDDLLLMEEQQLESMGDPLSVPTKLGDLTAMAVLPTMNTANGEGDLIAYYQFGVVSFATQEVPRETRFDGEGKQVQAGWDTKRLVTHLLNSISAVGHRAVAVLTRDHFFRSFRGLHFLKVILGEGTFNTENTNRISQDVEPILDRDMDLTGAATGFWMWGDRIMATTGLAANANVSTTSTGKGFVVWNQATTFTEDRTPRPMWEGLWVPDYGIFGVHQFADFALRPTQVSYGFICTDREGELYLAAFDKTLQHDLRDDGAIPIEWSFETGCYAPGGLNILKNVNDCLLEATVSSEDSRIRVLIRTDTKTDWAVWRTITPQDRFRSAGQRLRFTEALGRPPQEYREASWFQLRVEGLGYAEISLLELDFSPSVGKGGRSHCAVVDTDELDFFEFNSSPASTRWTL